MSGSPAKSGSPVNSEGVYDAIEQLDIADRGAYISHVVAHCRALSPKDVDISPYPVTKSMSEAIGVAVVQKYSDTVSNRGDIRERSRVRESQDSGLSAEEKGAFIADMRQFLAESIDRPGNAFDPRVTKEVISALKPTEIEQVFNYAFNTSIGLPENIILRPPLPGRVHEGLIGTFQRAMNEERVDFSFLYRNHNVNVEMLHDQAPNSWALAAIEGRRGARDFSKASQLFDRDHQQVISMAMPEHKLAPVKIPCNIRKSGNIQVETLVGEGNYEDEMASLTIHASGIKTLLKTGSFAPGTNLTDKAKIFGLTCLVGVVEPIRSKAALLTTPMFLDLLEAKQISSVTEYPMAPSGAVDAVRCIHEQHSGYLENARKMDERDSVPESMEKARVMLQSEGELLAKWSKLKDAPELSNILTDLDFCDKLKSLSKPHADFGNDGFKKFASQLGEVYARNEKAFNDNGVTREDVRAIVAFAETVPEKARGGGAQNRSPVSD